MHSHEVVVTGSEGYIGANLIKRLEGESMDYISYDLKHGKDVRQFHVPESSDTIAYHLAAQVGVPQCRENPLKAFETNVLGTKKVAETVDKTIFASSFAAQEPVSLYGATKAVAEQFVLREGGVVLRLSNVYGGDGFLEKKDTVITRFLEAKGRGEKAEIYGDGEQTRDFIHVNDVIDALLEAPTHHGTHNICTGIQTSILELAEIIGVDYVHTAARENDVRHSGGDPSPIVNPEHRIEEWVEDFSERT